MSQVDIPSNADETSPVQIRTPPQSNGRSVAEMKPASYDPMFRLAHLTTPINPEVNNTFSSYAERHDHNKMVAKAKEDKKIQKLVEKQNTETNYQKMMQEAMKRFK